MTATSEDTSPTTEADVDRIIRNLGEAIKKKMLLPKNMRKGNWRLDSRQELEDRIEDELSELRDAVSTEEIVNEAADTAAFCAMVIDNALGGRLSSACSVGCACGSAATACKDCETCTESRSLAKGNKHGDYSSYLYR